MFTDSDLLTMIREPFAEMHRQPSPYMQPIYETQKRAVLSSLHENWYALSIYIDMYQVGLKNRCGSEFLAYMVKRLPTELYTLLVRLYNVELSLQQYDTRKTLSIVYEELTFT